jgi:hypothetical protein
MKCWNLVEAMPGITAALARSGNALRIRGQIVTCPGAAALAMLLNLDQTTVANMTAALEYVCKQIPSERDSHETRKAIADAMLGGASSGARSLPQLQEIGFAKLKEIIQPKKRGWRWWRK